MTLTDHRKQNTELWQKFVKALEGVRDCPSRLNDWHINIAAKRILEVLGKDMYSNGLSFKSDAEDRFLNKETNDVFRRMKDSATYSYSFRKIFDIDPRNVMIGLRNSLADAVVEDYSYDVF